MLEVFCVEARPLCMEMCSNVSDVYGYTCTHAALKPLASSGYVVVRCGIQPSAEKTKANFICKVDAFVLNDVTKKPLSSEQKPVGLFTEIIQLYTVPSEWVLSGFSDLGKCIIMHGQHNTTSLRTQLIHRYFMLIKGTVVQD